ncbi:MAG: AMP-binding protein [Paludibacteraceae bacterium]|nr:AMP-binding protein [Paludibacteraceae bacterium]
MEENRDNYLIQLASTIRTNWDQPALTDFYLSEDGTAQDTSRGNHYTYGEMYVEICRVAELLTSLGLQKGDHIAICGANSAHWVIAYLAIAKMQGVSVTVMHTLMPDQIASLVDFSDAKALFTDEDIWGELASSNRSYMGGLSSVISLSDWSLLEGRSDRAMTERRPRDNRDISFPKSAPDDLAMICFTSGTSGMPKGVMLSNKNVNNNVAQSYSLNPICSERKYLALLHPAHMSGLIDVVAHLAVGKYLHVFKCSLSVDNIIYAYKLLSPYMIISIPQLIMLCVKRRGFVESLRGCKLIFLGGAKLSKEEEKEIIQLGIPLSIIYGQTETGASISISPYKQHRLGSCGKIVSGMTARISPVGEILVKGENVMLGYYKDPEATAQKIDSDGWLHTGDKGHLDEDGYLYVEGRLEQDIIVLPNGENIRPDNIESLINALPEVSESLVLARDGKLVAIVVPDSQMSNHKSQITNTDLRRKILRAINPSLPLYSQLYDIEITDQPLARTEKQTLKRYLYN